MTSPPIPHEWRYHVLQGLGAPTNHVNLIALAYWAVSEGVPATWSNPLATTLNCCGGRSVNATGVKAYPTFDAGVTATVRTLKLSYYTAIVAALRRGSDLTAIWRAINASPWCAHCQGGRYPVALADYIAAVGGNKQFESHPAPIANPTQPPEIDSAPHIRAIADRFGVAAGAYSNLRKRLNTIAGVKAPKPWRPR